MNISIQDFKESFTKPHQFQIIDVRSELEYHTYNIGGKNIPLGTLPALVEDLDLETDQEIIVVCQHGIRSETARIILENHGFTKVKNLKGGLTAYNKNI
jgi:rhodanese-related sulfurtransferase